MALRNLPKHEKYKINYKPLDYFWGLGVEHETYLKTSQTKTFSSFTDHMKPERYSVSYYKVYNQPVLKDILPNKITVPILINGHTFTHTDKFNQHKTTYEKEPKPNPKYTGQTFFEWVCVYSEWLKANYEQCYCWDGDTIEFMTQKFYKTSVPQVLRELEEIEGQFEQELARLPKQGFLIAYGPLKLASPMNEPFATHLTNLNNIAMFNNGTIHINITLPTRLSLLSPATSPYSWQDFHTKHQKLARLIQWMEPLWIACYGSLDPLSTGAKGSQRVAVSRYIGLGTFDTETMPEGKINQIQRPPLTQIPWYSMLYEKCPIYNCELTEIGLDMNFNKHGVHGLELRFFDQMPSAWLREVLEGLILIADTSMRLPLTRDPRKDVGWQVAAADALIYGREWILTPDQSAVFFMAFGLPALVSKENFNVRQVLDLIIFNLPRGGECWKRMSGSGSERRAIERWRSGSKAESKGCFSFLGCC